MWMLVRLFCSVRWARSWILLKRSSDAMNVPTLFDAEYVTYAFASMMYGTEVSVAVRVPPLT